MSPSSLVMVATIFLILALMAFLYFESTLKLKKVSLPGDPLDVFEALMEIANKKKWIPRKDGYSLDDKYFEFTQLNWVGMNDEITVAINEFGYFINIRGRHFHVDKLISNFEFLLRLNIENKRKPEPSRS
jgi:hypothetical protein